jgi:hypothetical protein
VRHAGARVGERAARAWSGDLAPATWDSCLTLFVDPTKLHFRRWSITGQGDEANPPPELNRAAPGAKNYASNEVDGSRSARTRQRNGQVHR